MKKTFTKTFFLLFAVFLFTSKISSAQIVGGPCSYTFTYTVAGKAINFNNTPDVNAGTTNSITWTINNAPFSNTNDPSYNVTTAGTYVVCMTVVDMACPSSPITFCDTVRITSNGGGTVGISEKDLAKSINVFPNPSTGKINLVSAIANVEAISVYNAIGEIVFEDKKTSLKNELDLTTLPNGVYILKAKTEAGIVTKKITITK